MSDEIRRGKLQMTPALLAQLLLLPKDHKVVSIQPELEGLYYTLVVEGPDMPVVYENKSPEPVDLDAQLNYVNSQQLLKFFNSTVVWYFVTTKWKHSDRPAQVAYMYVTDGGQKETLLKSSDEKCINGGVAIFTMDIIKAVPVTGTGEFVVLQRGERLIDSLPVVEKSAGA